MAADADSSHPIGQRGTSRGRLGFFVVPVLTFIATRRICLGLQRRDREKVLHGRETGIIKRLPHGEFIEVHEYAPSSMRSATWATM